MKKYILIFFLQILLVSIGFAQTQYYGGGVYIEGAGRLTNCVISNNLTGGDPNNVRDGGGIAFNGNGAVINNCLIVGNKADFAGSAIYQIAGNNTVTNSTFVGNKIIVSGNTEPCIMAESGSLNLINCVVWGNKQRNGTDVSDIGSNITATYCAFEGDTPYPGIGNIALSTVNTDPTGPNFIDANFGTNLDPLLGNTRLAANSILRGAGNTALLPAGLTTDLDGNPRKYGNFVDMGCYQSYSPIWLSSKTVTYTGLPQAVDAPAFFDTNGNSVSQPGSTTVMYTYYKDGVSLGVGVVPANVGVYEVVAVFSGGGSLPAGTSNRVTLVINKAPLTVTANDSTKIYNGIPFSGGSYTLSGIVDGKTQSQIINESAMTYGGTAQGAVLPGTYIISITGISSIDPNYNAPVISGVGTLRIEGIPAEIHSHLKDASICIGSSHIFSVDASGTNLSYQWYKGNNPIFGAIANTLQIENATKNDYDTYYVKVSNTTNTVISNHVRLWVADPLPSTLSFVEYPNPAQIGKSYLIQLAGYSDVTKYTWSYSKPGVRFQKSETTGNETMAIFSSEAIGKGTISVEMEHVCGNRIATQEIEVKYPTGIDNIVGERIKIYPNPVENELRIESGELRITKLEIFDVNGRILHQAQPNTIDYQLPVAHYSKGIYFVKIVTEAGETVKKIIKK